MEANIYGGQLDVAMASNQGGFAGQLPRPSGSPVSGSASGMYFAKNLSSDSPKMENHTFLTRQNWAGNLVYFVKYNVLSLGLFLTDNQGLVGEYGMWLGCHVNLHCLATRSPREGARTEQ
jgi:hypothetical protein